MKYYRGTLYYYTAPGEASHYYAWLGDPSVQQHVWEQHLEIKTSDVVEVRNGPRTNGIILRWFPHDEKALKECLKKSGWRLWCAALAEHWTVEVIKFDDRESLGH